MEFSLRKKPAEKKLAAAPDRVAPHVAPGMGTLPFAPGEVITTNPDDLTPQERKDLEALGWKPGMVIPADLAQQISAARKTVAESIRDGIAEMEASKHVLKPPKLVDINDLPPEHKASLQQAIKDAQNAVNINKLKAMHQQAMQTMDPNIREVLDKSKNIEIYDDRPKEAPRKSPTPPPPPQPEAVVDAPPAAEPASAAEAPAATGVTLTNCPHCNWRLADPEPAEPTDADKLNFANAIWSGDPFHKEYLLMGGQVRVIFRSPTVEQSELAMTQLAIDQKHNRCPSFGDLFEKLITYRACMGILKVTIAGETMEVAREVDAAIKIPSELGEPIEEDDTPLPLILKALTSHGALKQEFVWRMLLTQYKHFSRLYETLEARATDDSFWKAIES